MNRPVAFITLAALAVGGVAGWLAAEAWGGAAISSKPPYHDSIEDNASRTGAPRTPNGRARRPATASAKPRRKALIRSSADAEVQKRILENQISYLEKCIAAAKGGDAKPSEKKRETNAEIIERLMKLPTDNERYFAFMRLDEQTQMSFTMGELKKLCPKQMSIDGDDGVYEKLTERLDRMTEVTARRIGILDALDPSGLSDDERSVHAEYMEFLAEWPDVFAGMIDERDSMTFGEVIGRFKKAASTSRRAAELVKKEHGMLVAQVVKSFEIPDGDAVELRTTLDDVQDFTSSGYFEKKD